MINEENINYLLKTNLKKYRLGSPLSSRIKQIYNHYDFKMPSLIVSLIYLKKYSKINKVTNENIVNIFTSCIILANKFLEDINIHSKNINELHIIKTLDWNLFVSEDEYFIMLTMYYKLASNQMKYQL
jgi:hypothetical protein